MRLVFAVGWSVHPPVLVTKTVSQWAKLREEPLNLVREDGIGVEAPVEAQQSRSVSRAQAGMSRTG